MGKRKTIMLLITYKCNLHCSYCYEPKLHGFRMKAETAKRIIAEQISSLGDEYDSVEIQFMGGEPLLEFPLIKEISEWLWSCSWEKELLVLFAPTNGTLLNEEMKSWFTANREKIQLGLSFDGDMSMQNTNRSASYGLVDLDYFVKTWPEQSVKMTISPETIATMADGVIHLHNAGFRYISADLAMGVDIKWDKDSLLAYKEELKKLTDYYIAHQDLIPFSMLRLDITSIARPKRNVKTCSCGEDLICVDWTGKTYGCHLFSPIALPIEKAQLSNELYDFTNHLQFSHKVCQKCILNDICNHCYGMNYICTGDVAIPSPSQCKAFKILFAANCRFRLMLATSQQDKQSFDEINNIIQTYL